MWNLVNLQYCFVRALLKKEYAVRTLQICSGDIHNMSIDTKHLFRSRSSATCHHAERISCKITERQKFQSAVSLKLEYVATPVYHKLSVALHFCPSLSDALGQHSVTRTMNFLSRAWLTPHQFNPHAYLCAGTLGQRCGKGVTERVEGNRNV